MGTSPLLTLSARPKPAHIAPESPEAGEMPELARTRSPGVRNLISKRLGVPHPLEDGDLVDLSCMAHGAANLACLSHIPGRRESGGVGDYWG
jgi:hypothetical protein